MCACTHAHMPTQDFKKEKSRMHAGKLPQPSLKRRQKSNTNQQGCYLKKRQYCCHRAGHGAGHRASLPSSARGHCQASATLSCLGSRRKGPEAALHICSKTTKLAFNIFKVDRNVTFIGKKTAHSVQGGTLTNGEPPSCRWPVKGKWREADLKLLEKRTRE